MTEPSYITWNPADDEKRAIALHQWSEAAERVRPVVRTVGTDVYLNVAPRNVSIRDGYSREDYDQYRPSDSTPRTDKDWIGACDNAYHENGIVKNVVDLMSDFVAKGIDVVHPSARTEKFFRELFHKKWKARRVTERFANYLFRHGTVLVKRQTAKLRVRDEKALRQAQGADVEPDTSVDVVRREVPWRYSFVNPRSVDLLCEELATMVGDDGFLYGLRIPPGVQRKVMNPATAAEQFIVNRLPAEVREAIQRGETLLPLDPQKLSVHFYKRDDWKAWPRPMLGAVLKDIHMLEKMKLADLSALDGVISCIRVWKMGSLEHGVMPHPSLMQRLAEMLTNNVGGGVMDLVWGPDLELVETSTEAHRFLGITKYAPVLQAIYSALGIPQTLTASNTESGFTNNYLSLQTLIERLEYARYIIAAFWEHELALVQKAMGFRQPARLRWDNMLTDKATEHKILLDMADRDLIDEQTLQEEFGFDPEILRVRKRREMRKRKRGVLPVKAGPFHQTGHMDSLEKLFAGTGAYTPEEFGVELKPRKDGSKPPAEVASEFKAKQQPPQGTAPKGQPGQGREPGQKDQRKRKQKVVRPRTSARFIHHLAQAENMQAQVARLVTNPFLQTVGKKNLRELTDEEARDFEAFKFALLCQMPLGAEVTQQSVASLLNAPLVVPAPIEELMRATIGRHVETYGREPTVEALRRYQSAAFALYRGQYDEESGGGDDGVSALPRTEEEPAAAA